MKFRGIRPIIDEKNAWREVTEALRDLFQGLTKLSFTDNMESFEITNSTIGAGQTYKWKNQLKLIPTRWIVVRNSSGMPISDNGFDGWDINTVSLKNVGASSTTISVIFMR